MSPLLVAILFCIILYKLYEYYASIPPNTPPCLPRIPIVGSYWHILWANYDYPHKAVEYYVKKLKSKVVSCYFGPFFAVIANDHASIKEVLTREEFDGRLTEVYVLKARAFGRKLGIFFTDGWQWKEQRRFALRHMRDFGFGRRQEKFERDVLEEVTQFIDILKQGPINDEEKTVVRDGCALFPNILFSYSVNSIWLIMFGEKFDRPDHRKLRFLCESAMMFQRAADTSGGAISQRPFLRFFGNMFGYKNIMLGNYRIVDFVKDYLENHKRTHTEDSDRGLADRYLEKLKECDETSTFTEDQLIMTMVDFMFPVLSAMPSVLTHCFKFVMHHPEVLKKVQGEIDTVVGTGRHVTWEDRQKLPYTEATIREVLRCETLTPFSVIHRSTTDTTLCGYSIPKDTAVITNLAGMNSDPDFWGDPENFRPERFLSKDGELLKDSTLPFGFGHRVCAGETFARYNIFQIFAALLQNFNFVFVDGQPTKLEDKLPGLIVTPMETWIRLVPRR